MTTLDKAAEVHAFVGQLTWIDGCDITVNAPTAFGNHPFDAAVAFGFRHDILDNHFDAVIAMNRGHHLLQLFAENAKQWRR